MLRLQLFATLFAILFQVTAAQAASSTGDFAIKDAGLVTCKQYSEEQAKVSNRYFQFVGWIMGYLTSYNRFAEDTLDIAPWQSTDLLAAFIGRYCQSNPDARLVVATNQLIAALAPQRLHSNSKRVEVKAGEKSAFIYEAILRRAQQVLLERGHLKGTADGKFGPSTRKAFEDFQKENKLNITGLPDQATLLLLFR